MRIGIAAPIEIASLSKHLPRLTDADKKLGLGGTAVNILIDGFVTAGHHVTVFTLDDSINKKYIIEGPNLKVIFGHFRKNGRMKWFDFCRKERVQLTTDIQLEKNKLDIVNAHWSYEYAIAAIRSGVRQLITFRDDASSILKISKHPYRLTRWVMDRWVRRNGRKFSYNSPYLKSLIGIEGPVLPNPIPDDSISASSRRLRDSNKPSVCFIANGWDERKNPENALKAFSLLSKSVPNATFHLIGKGFEPDNPGVLKFQQANAVQNVFFQGHIPHHELMNRLNEYDIMLHTAREESFGNNLIEAMAKGIPVIGGFDSGAVPWVLDEGRAGVLVDVENPSSICEAMVRLISNPVHYESISINGLSNVKRRFSQTAICALYINEYQSIIKSGPYQ